MKETINVALPKGRLGRKVYQMFADAGFECPELLEESRKLIFENEEKGIRYFWVKPSDVAIYVERGAADVGVVGKDILLESKPDVYELLDLKCGKCRMMVAAPKAWRDDTGHTLRVATKFPEIARKFYGGKSRDIDIIKLNGSSEILIVADGTCVPEVVAADMLSQAEHDRFATAVLVTDSPELAEAVPQKLEKQLNVLSREEIARASIEHNGKIILTEDIETAIDIANEIAPEHFELCVDNPFDYLDRIRNAGSIFLGKNCPEALGDYFAGPNHTLPTGGTARFNSPLSVDDFTKKMQYSYYTEDALAKIADKVARFAAEEGLDAHGRSVLVRKNRKER